MMTLENILEWIDNYENPQADLAAFQKELVKRINRHDYDTITKGGI